MELSNKMKVKRKFKLIFQTVQNDPSPFQDVLVEATPLKASMELQKEMHHFFNSYFCTPVDGLYPMTSYTISVRAWASHGRISMARNPLTVFTEKRSEGQGLICTNPLLLLSMLRIVKKKVFVQVVMTASVCTEFAKKKVDPQASDVTVRRVTLGNAVSWPMPA